MGMLSVSACRLPAPTVMATAAGTPALATVEISSRRVMATSVLFLVVWRRDWLKDWLIDWLRGGRFEFFRMLAVDIDSRHPGLGAALETLRRDPGSAADCSGHRPHQCRCAYFDSSSGTVNGRVGIGGSRQMNRDGFERTHSPNHALFRAAHTRSPDADRPHPRNLIEMAGGAGGVSDRSLAAELVEAPALAVPFVAERGRKPASIKVRPPRAILVDHALVGELRTVELIQLRQPAHSDVFQNQRQQVVRIGRAAGQVHDRFARHDVIDAYRARRIWAGRRHAAP